MIRRLLDYSLSKPLVTLVLALCIIAAGIWSWTTLMKVAYPDVGDTQVTVITMFPGRAAEEVEQQITLPIERELNAVPRVITRRSKTIFGLSVIMLTFEDGVSGPNRYVEMRAERDIICIISNCPQLNNPCNAYNPTPIEVLIWD